MKNWNLSNDNKGCVKNNLISRQVHSPTSFVIYDNCVEHVGWLCPIFINCLRFKYIYNSDVALCQCQCCRSDALLTSGSVLGTGRSHKMWVRYVGQWVVSAVVLEWRRAVACGSTESGAFMIVLIWNGQLSEVHCLSINRREGQNALFQLVYI